MASKQMDSIKNKLQEQLEENQLAGQRVLQSHQRLDQSKRDNENRM